MHISPLNALVDFINSTVNVTNSLRAKRRYRYKIIVCTLHSGSPSTKFQKIKKDANTCLWSSCLIKNKNVMLKATVRSWEKNCKCQTSWRYNLQCMIIYKGETYKISGVPFPSNNGWLLMMKHAFPPHCSCSGVDCELLGVRKKKNIWACLSRIINQQGSLQTGRRCTCILWAGFSSDS